MCEFSANAAFDKATNGQTGIKHKMWKTLSSMSLLKIVGEKLPPSERASYNKDELALGWRVKASTKRQIQPAHTSFQNRFTQT